MLPFLLLGCAPAAPPVLFLLDAVHEITLDTPVDSWSALEADPDEYVPASLSVDGVRIPEVGLRVKGRSGSYRDLSGKASFKVDVDRYDADASVAGLVKIDLDNMVTDCTMARETLAWTLAREAKVPGPRVDYAALQVNGAPWGLYLVVEDLDRRFLDARYLHPEGNLYDGDYVKLDDGFESQVDFDDETQGWFELDEGTDVDLADIRAVTAALDAVEDAGAPLPDLVDWTEVQRTLAWEDWVGQVDGYGLQQNNYRVYFDPGDADRMDLLPWDADFTFVGEDTWDSSWWDPRGRLARLCVADGACRADLDTAVRDVAVTADGLDLETRLDALLAFTDEAFSADPRQECNDDDRAADTASVLRWIRTRSAEVGWEEAGR